MSMCFVCTYKKYILRILILNFKIRINKKIVYNKQVIGTGILL